MKKSAIYLYHFGRRSLGCPLTPQASSAIKTPFYVAQQQPSTNFDGQISEPPPIHSLLRKYHMGGDTSREKRKLKRLQAAGDKQSILTPIESSTTDIDTNEATVQSNTSNALIRLRRKLERKASGKFKLASVDRSRSETKQSQKHKPEYRVHSASKRPKKNDTDSNRRSPLNKKKGNFAHNKSPAKQIPKKKDEKKKPKHLNRKMAQLSKSLADGGNIAELEVQMKQIAEQIEQMKSMKGVKNDTKLANVVQGKEKEAETANSSSSSELGNDSNASSSKDAEKLSETKNKTESSSSSSDSSDDSADEEILEQSNTRSRGKRRRGRREKTIVSKNGEEGEKDTSEKLKTGESEMNDVSTSAIHDSSTPSKTKTPKKDDTRHCIGRKPVTDYTVGNKYKGKVKYIKTTLGAFIDVGSHSDAFCHISCISDGYVSTVEEVVNVGDEVEVRVVEIDREKKRITVSLRSDEMAAIEEEKLQTKQKSFQKEKKPGHTRFRSEKAGQLSKDDSIKPEKVETENNTNTKSKHDNKLGRTSQTKSTPIFQIKTGADLKRERKLARRAERRAQQMATE